MAYTFEKKKYLGAYYTPSVLADFLASTILSLVKCDKDKPYTALDPATGDSILLKALSDICSKESIHMSVVGIDVEESAIEQSKKIFNNSPIGHTFICTDALYPFRESTPKKGWTALTHKYLTNGVDLIVSNPPWGANKEKYSCAHRDFATAKGQFDIYDLFIETSLKCLNDNGYYAFIVPDTIYEQEHGTTRELLLKETTIKKIVRLGEGFFNNVNISATLIFGLKSKNRNYDVTCSHLPSEIRKNILNGSIDLKTSIQGAEHRIPVKAMIEAGYDFLTDIEPHELKLIRKLSKSHKLGEFVDSHRGIELSKRGVVLFCDSCGKWFPKPRKKSKDIIQCPYCRRSLVLDSYKSECIITSKKDSECIPLITGEDVYRYNTISKMFIKKGYNGINYKNNSLYNDTKILVRKTGVGITAGIDYQECATNQVVYILKRKNKINSHITNEVILSIINSRITTYYIIKTRGSNGWKTHPYISQAKVLDLPFPNINTGDSHVVEILDEITSLVKQGLQYGDTNIPSNIDAKVEKAVAKLFDFGVEDYKIIYETLNNVQQMIPFKRLLNIKIEDIFNDGL